MEETDTFWRSVYDSRKQSIHLCEGGGFQAISDKGLTLSALLLMSRLETLTWFKIGRSSDEAVSTSGCQVGWYIHGGKTYLV